MSWIVNIAGKAEDFLNKIDQSTAVALQSGTDSGGSKSRSKKKSSGFEYGDPTSTALPTAPDTRVTLSNSIHDTTSTSLNSTNSFTRSVETETSTMTSGRTNSRPKPPRPSKLKNAPKPTLPDVTNGGSIMSDLNGQASQAVGANCIKPANHKTDEELLDFLNSPSQNLDESSLLRSEIASQSREMNLLLRNYKKLQQEFDALRKSGTQNESNHAIEPSNREIVTNGNEALNLDYEKQIMQKNAEINELRQQLKSVLDKLEAHEEMQPAKNRLAQLELENQHLLSEKDEVSSKLTAINLRLENSDMQAKVVKEKLIAVEREYSSYKEKAKSILQAKDELIANMSSNSNHDQGGQNCNINSPSNQQPNESQFLSEIGSLRSERELLQAEITQNRFYTDSLREENNRLETELTSLRTSNTNLHSLLSKEKQMKHNNQEENLKLSQQISTLQLDFERERIEKMKLQEKVEKYEASGGSGMRKIHSMNDFESGQQKYGPSSEFDETDTLRTRITALSQSLLEKQNYINALSADKQLLQLRIERLQSKVEKMNQEVEYHNAESFSLDTDALSNHSVVSSQPLYLSESPWDSRISRRVKRAYAQVDTFCCQIGLILRQRPNIRLGFCLYIIFLHLWVFFVLFSWSHNHTSADAT